tara:strand:+ start:451 stop:672 length:222 start_codon:yes stop_codon:yes gene_type:complete
MDDSRKCYDEIFEKAIDLLNKHQMPVELVAGTLMAIAQRLYKTHLTEVEFNLMMDSIRDTDVEPYNVEKVRLH